MKLAAAIGAIVALAVAACGTSSAHTRITVPQSIPNNRLLTSGTTLTVPVGTIVYVVLVEAEEYEIGHVGAESPGFPWLTPTSSDRTVLAPVHLCKQTVASSLASTVTGFRAPRRGSATLTAPLAPGWRTGKIKPRAAADRVRIS